MTHAKFHFNWFMLTSIFGIWAFEPPPLAWRMTEKAGPDRVKQEIQKFVKRNRQFETQIEELENKIAKAAQGTNAGFRRKKIRSMKGMLLKRLKN